MKKLILTFSVLVVMAGCNDEFLDRYPQTEIAKENFFNSEEDLATYVYSLYDFPGIGIYVSDHSTDNAATTGATEIKNIMTGTPTASNITGGWSWEALRNVNFFLENFRNAQISEEALNHYEGLARFFRARFYMDKVKRFSDVPWYDKVLETDDEDLFKPRDSRRMVVEKIFEDYAFAAEHVRSEKVKGEVNKYVVLAYMARHALYEGTYRKYHSELQLESTANAFLELARDAASQIMDDGEYAVYNTGSPLEDYNALFTSTDLSDNPEVILATFSESDLRNSGWWGYMFGNYEVNPVRDLLQAYLMDDGGYYTDFAGYEENQFVEEFENRDNRLYQTYAYPGWELINTSTYAQGGGIYIQQLAKNFSGYHQIKGFVNNTDQTVMNNVDVPVLRYAETLLTYAEARAELGELTQEDLDISVNLLRARAGMPGLTISPAVDAVQQARYPGLSSSTSQWQELLEIRRERRIELALEGFRFDDLMRWAAGKLIEKEPEGIYFPGLGEYDLTGDGVEDIKIIPNTESIPAVKEKNSLDIPYVYYRAGLPGSDAGIYLTGGTSGTLVTDAERGTFVEPKYYYRPVPQSQVVLNPNLEQIFGW
ncbi:MAG: RagB/SusD family nutrient uptake outer membrane protein [Bacteroidia bacterium]|nr:RagB/SusD family nutrient uptake outer membrane protein [Bacteroidia bacterium]